MPSVEVSVLMPTYRGEASIQSAIESALALPSAEVIVAPDDGSTAYRGLEQRYPGRVRVLAASNRSGPGACRNRAFLASSGAFVTMLDSDDTYASGALAEAHALALANAKGVAFIRTVYVSARCRKVCRELQLSGLIDLPAFVDFHGSVHALYARAMWRPYADDVISEDVLHDAGMLVACGDSAPLTQAAYLLTIRHDSLSASTDQAVFNAVYQHVSRSAEHPSIRRLYREKHRMGCLFLESQATDPSLSFHEFVERRRIRNAG